MEGALLEMKPEMEFAREVALQAGRILRDHFDHAPQVEWKGENDPVTDADHAASRFIIEELQQRYPDDGVVSEERPDDEVRLHKSRVWSVDPMDGTKEFIARRPEFAVMIGLAIDGTPQLGVVYQPITRKLYYGSSGEGSFVEEEGLNPKQLHVSAESNPSRMVIALSRSHPSKKVDRVRSMLGIGGSVSTGSIGLKVGLICEGVAHLYLYAGNRTYQWDTCAPEAILREAGGRMTDLSNTAMVYNRSELKNSNGVIASSGPLHDRIAAAVAAV
jgi:3'(2'), 5'-bisphosphate nucleotidase